MRVQDCCWSVGLCTTPQLVDISVRHSVCLFVWLVAWCLAGSHLICVLHMMLRVCVCGVTAPPSHGHLACGRWAVCATICRGVVASVVVCVCKPGCLMLTVTHQLHPNGMPVSSAQLVVLSKACICCHCAALLRRRRLCRHTPMVQADLVPQPWHIALDNCLPICPRQWGMKQAGLQAWPCWRGSLAARQPYYCATRCWGGLRRPCAWHVAVLQSVHVCVLPPARPSAQYNGF